MKNNSDIVHVRFMEQDDALTFTRMPYALFLGVPIEREWLVDTPSYRHNPTRTFLGYPPFTENQYQSYNLAQAALEPRKEEPDDPRDRRGMAITGFKKKYTNKQIFEKLTTNPEINIQAATI